MGVHVEVEVRVGYPFAAKMDGPAVKAAMGAMAAAYETDAGFMGSGGSIPLVARLQGISPNAEVILWGAEDVAQAKIHASNESVDLNEIERLIVAQALTLQTLGGGADRSAGRIAHSLSRWPIQFDQAVRGAGRVRRRPPDTPPPSTTATGEKDDDRLGGGSHLFPALARRRRCGVRMGQCGGGATLVLAVHHRVVGAGLRHRGQARAGPITGIVYSLGQGALVGSISKIYETFYEGIVFLALTATVAVFVGALLLYIFRIIKVTGPGR